MVWIYGGIFIFGDENYNTYGPDYFLDEEVVAVTFNYRLGVFGFLSTEDLVMPDNNGLRDQILALKWVQKNVAAFGGNPNNVTVFGETAGAASISYLILSPLTAGLYRTYHIERQHVRVASKHVDVYYYELSYQGRLGNPNRTRQGTAHTEGWYYIFRTSNDYPNLTTGDKNTRYRMAKLWTNFAKFGNPTPANDSLLQNVTWAVASTTKDLTYLNIRVNLTVETNPRPYNMNFWDYLYENFSTGPYDTY